jgi:predicted membrane channel-forming protein YqfA (hemolysin III family)
MKAVVSPRPYIDRVVEERSRSTVPIFDAIAIAGLAATVAIHTTELSGKIEETQYLGFGYLLLIAASIVSIVMISQRDERGWILGGLACAATLVGFVLTRTTGLPNASDDVGNWSEPIAVWSWFAEGIVVVLSVQHFSIRRSSTRR